MDTLLKTLIADEKKIKNKLYKSGPYWKYKNKKTIYQIKKKSLKNFRGLHSGIGTSFSDNLIYDIKNELSLKGRILSFFYSIPLLNRIYERQLKITSTHISNFLKLQSIVFEKNERVKYLLEKYTFHETTEFGCVQKFNYNNKEYSCHYLEMANRIDFINKFIDFKNIKKYFEIGGGFGSNIHFLLKNFKNINKIIYLDSVPNIYIGTQYLKKFFGNNVIDYLKTKETSEIKFSENNELEIICITPWQIEKLNIEIDHFHNAASFVEMPNEVISNYVKYIFKNKPKTISLVSYDGFNPKSTFDPKELNIFFNNSLKIYENSKIINELKRQNLYLIKN